MTDHAGPDAAYREQLSRFARALAADRPDGLADALAERSTPAHVELFTESNRKKREEKLRAQLDFVAGAFADFDGLLAAYLRECPAAAYDDANDDAGRFLEWLKGAGGLTPEQGDHVGCQQARYAVEAQARRDRAGHLRFQGLWATARHRAAGLDTDAGLLAHLNPARAWTRFATAALLDDGAALPADVLFFAVGPEISAAVLEPPGRELVRELEPLAPCTLAFWAGLSGRAGREELVGLCRDLAEMGLVAFGPNGPA